MTAYFTDEDANKFNPIALMHASEVAITGDSPLHEGKVTDLLYVQDVDPCQAVQSDIWSQPELIRSSFRRHWWKGLPFRERINTITE